MKKKLKLRVWWIRNVPNDAEYFEVDNVEEAISKLDKLAKKDLKNPAISDNAGGLEVFEDGKWVEYYDDLGRNIDDIMEEREDE